MGLAAAPRSAAGVPLRGYGVPGFRGRHLGLGLARQRHRRAVALVQVPPPARAADPARPRRQLLRPARQRAQRSRRPSAARGRHGGDRPELSRQSRPRPRRLDRPVRPLSAGGLLLQDVLPAEGQLDVLGALHPRQGRTGPAVTRHAARLLRQGLPVLRRRGDRRWARRARRRRGRNPRRRRSRADRGRAGSSAASCAGGASWATRNRSSVRTGCDASCRLRRASRF